MHIPSSVVVTSSYLLYSLLAQQALSKVPRILVPVSLDGMLVYD